MVYPNYRRQAAQGVTPLTSVQQAIRDDLERRAANGEPTRLDYGFALYAFSHGLPLDPTAPLSSETGQAMIGPRETSRLFATAYFHAAMQAADAATKADMIRQSEGALSGFLNTFLALG